MAKNEVNIRNKKAKFEYHLEEEFVAGIVIIFFYTVFIAAINRIYYCTINPAC
mgnify:CR=1 FL=1